MNKKAIQQLIAILFVSRDFAQSRHLNASTISEHLALDEFYNAIPALTDKLAEAWQGKNLEKIGEIPRLPIDFKGESVKGLQAQLDLVEEHRKEVTKGYSPLENLIDEIAEQYLSTINKLTFYK